MGFAKRILQSDPWFNETGEGCWECGLGDRDSMWAGICDYCRELDRYIGPQPHRDLPDPVRYAHY